MSAVIPSSQHEENVDLLLRYTEQSSLQFSCAVIVLDGDDETCSCFWQRHALRVSPERPVRSGRQPEGKLQRTVHAGSASLEPLGVVLGYVQKGN